MNKPEDQFVTQKSASAKSAQRLDYAAWVDSDGHEHTITRDMIDEIIADMVAGPDCSLQGHAMAPNPKRKPVRYSQTRPR